MSALPHLLIRLRLGLTGRLLWRPFLRLTEDPDKAQRQVLRSILRQHQATAFGQKHGFAEIATPDEFAVRVPIHTYEQLRPYIERQEQQKAAELVAGRPVLYARTSGTTGQPKYIPILHDTIRRHRRDQRLFSYCHHAAIPGLFRGKTLAFVSPAIEGTLPGGTPYGSMSGLVYQSMPWLLRRSYVVPAPVFEAVDHAWKYRVIALFALLERDISFIAAANPSTLLKLAGLIHNDAAEFIAAVATGRLPEPSAEDEKVYRAAQASFRGDSRRAMELQSVVRLNSQPTFSQLWPGLKAVSCWREGSCRVLLPTLRRLLDPQVAELELGYLSSECRGSLPVDSHRHLEVPTLHENYFEFVEREDWQAGRTQTIPLAQLATGRAYYVVVTTPDGLYRYFMNDVVMVDGYFHRTPTIKFLEKGAGATNITGEKLYESQVCSAMDVVQRACGWDADFFVLVADPAQLVYRLYLEAPGRDCEDFAGRLDVALAAGNIEYEAKRASGRLRSVELHRLRAGAGAAWQAHLVARGQREAQFKFIRLQSCDKVDFDLEAYLSPSP